MAEINDLNVTDASNTARFPEKGAPSSLNDSARALEGILARGLKDTIDSALASGGSSSDYTVSANRTIGSYYDGLTIVAELNHTNDDTAVTLNVDSVGAGTVLQTDGTAPPVGTLVSGGKYIFVYDGTNFLVIRTPVVDEDDMASDLVTAVPTQQSVKAYVDGRIVVGTEQATTSGTDIDFSASAGAKRITINFVGNSLSGTGNILIQLGDAGGVEATGYLGSGSSFANATQTVTNATSAFLILMGDAAAVLHGSVTLSLEDSTNFTWVASGSLSRSDTTVAMFTSGSKSLSAELTTVRITPTAGVWDAGAINVQIEY